MAITLIQSASVGSSVLFPGILSIAFPSPVTAGNMLVATTYDSGGNAGLASDTQGNTYTQALHVSGLEIPGIFLAYAIAGSSGANTVSFDFGLITQGSIVIAEYSGMGATPTVDQQSQNTGTIPGTTVTPGAITTTSADELIISVSVGEIGFPPSSTTWAVDSSFTIEQQVDNLVTGNREMSVTYADRIVSATGTFNPTFTTTSVQPQNFLEAGIVSFIPSGAPAPTTGVLKGNQQIATTRAGIKQRLITIPEMRSYDDVRKVMAKAVQDLQTHIATQLPVTNYLNKRISNVGTPMSADDVVTLRYLQGGGNVSPVSVTVQQNNGLGGGASPTDPVIVNGTTVGGGTVNYVGGSNITVTGTTSGGHVNVTFAATPTPYTGYGSEFPLTDPTIPTFSWRNQGSATVTANTRSINLFAPAVSGDQVRGREVSAPTAPVSFTVAIIPQLHAQNFNQGGMYVTDGTKLVLLNLGATTNGLSVSHYTSVSAFSSTVVQPNMFLTPAPIYLKIYDDGTKLHFYWGVDGSNFIELTNENRTAFLATAPTAFGWHANSNNATWPVSIVLLSWVQGVS